MSFDTPHGTRGSRQSFSNPVARLTNAFVARRIRSKGGRGLMGMNTLVLTTVGAKSGESRNNPVAWFDGGAGTWLVVASAGGARRNPDWYHNLAAHPDQVRIELDGQSVDVVATQLDDEEREQAWKKIVAEAPRFGSYEQATDRKIPVIRLSRRDA